MIQETKSTVARVAAKVQSLAQEQLSNSQDDSQRPPQFAVVGHTNAGKTSLLRTLTRQVDFGEVSNRPGTTRHAQAIDLRFDGQIAARFIDTPGLEDSVALLRYLNDLQADTKPQRIKAFLGGPEAHISFEQEAKVLRALIDQVDAAMLVIDTREPVLPKFRAEVEILTWCAKPIMPVLNFVRDSASRQEQWRQMLRESNLHAQAQFDAVAPFNGSEQQLYADLATLLPSRRKQLDDIIQALAQQAQQRRQTACRAIASSLIDVASMRRTLQAHEAGDQAYEHKFSIAFEDGVRDHVRRAVRDLLDVFAFRAGDAHLADIPMLDQRWEDDLFNPELLKGAGMRLGLGVIIGAGIGVVADVAVAGLSLGAATTLGATLGAALSGGWQSLAQKIKNRIAGVRELTTSDPMLFLLADRLITLCHALEHRGHAAQEQLRVGDSDQVKGDTLDTEKIVQASVITNDIKELRILISALDPARGHPDWERGHGAAPSDAARLALEVELADQLGRLLAIEPPPRLENNCAPVDSDSQ